MALKNEVSCPRKDGGGYSWPVEDIDLLQKDSYYGNILVKRGHVMVDMTPEQIEEVTKCAEDPIYFIKTYCRIISLDEGIIPFRMFKYQEEMVRLYKDNRFCLTLTARQMGKCLGKNVGLNIYNKSTGKYYDNIPMGLFYEYQRAKRDGEPLPDIEEYLRVPFRKNV